MSKLSSADERSSTAAQRPNTIAELRTKWAAQRDAFARFGASIDGAMLAEEVLRDIDSLDRAQSVEAVTLTEAHLIGGYSVDHLQRLVAHGHIENVGRKGRPRIRRNDVPIRPGYRLHQDDPVDQLSARRRIVASVAIGNTEAS